MQSKLPSLIAVSQRRRVLFVFFGDDMFHHILPRAQRKIWIAGVEINPRHLQIQIRLRVRFVVSVQQLLRFDLVPRVERLLFAADFVFEIKNAPGTFDKTELIFHCFSHGYECETNKTAAVSGPWASDDRAETSF